MRADEPFTDVDTNKIFMPKYINQLRADRLMRGKKIAEIAEALEARAKRIKEGM